MKDWNQLQTDYFASVPGQFKYKEWSLFALEKINYGLKKINFINLINKELTTDKGNDFDTIKESNQSSAEFGVKEKLSETQSKLYASVQQSNELQLNVLAY